MTWTSLADLLHGNPFNSWNKYYVYLLIPRLNILMPSHSSEVFAYQLGFFNNLPKIRWAEQETIILDVPCSVQNKSRNKFKDTLLPLMQPSIHFFSEDAASVHIQLGILIFFACTIAWYDLPMLYSCLCFFFFFITQRKSFAFVPVEILLLLFQFVKCSWILMLSSNAGLSNSRPRAKCVTRWPRPRWAKGGSNHMTTSCDFAVMPWVWHPCSNVFAMFPTLCYQQI